jgi:hypothetical protein
MCLTACALWEEPPSQPLIPLVLPSEPTLVFQGNCNNNASLADWLQYSTYYTDQFAELVTTTAAGDKPAIRSGILEMVALRDEYAQVKTPDCAEPGQRLFFSAMNRALVGFQQYVNGETNSLGNLLPEVLGEIDRINLVQDDLRIRLDKQLQESVDE